ncbi:MAG: diadenylate cyclase [Lachnotalea sp.]
MKNKFADADTINLLKIIKNAVTQSHGTTVVITDKAKDEAKRLSTSSFLISPVYADKMIKYLTSIDGAILIDPLANCHAIGVILDGCSSDNEDISQGARHNSARRYKSINPKSIVIVISEDGHVTSLY